VKPGSILTQVDEEQIFMPAEYSLDHADRLVSSRAWGSLSESDLSDHVREMQILFANGTLDAAWAQIADFTGTTSVSELTAEGVRRLAQGNPWPRTALRVFVAPTTTVYGLTRMYQILAGADPDSLCIVNSRTAALALINERRRPADSVAG
jgi:hypothetical protein